MCWVHWCNETSIYIMDGGVVDVRDEDTHSIEASENYGI